MAPGMLLGVVLEGRKRYGKSAFRRSVFGPPRPGPRGRPIPKTVSRQTVRGWIFAKKLVGGGSGRGRREADLEVENDGKIHPQSGPPGTSQGLKKWLKKPLQNGPPRHPAGRPRNQITVKNKLFGAFFSILEVLGGRFGGRKKHRKSSPK